MYSTTITNACKKVMFNESYITNFRLSADEGILIYLSEGKAKAVLNNKPMHLLKNTFIVCKHKDALSIQFSKKVQSQFYLIEFSSAEKAIHDLQSHFNTSPYQCYKPQIVTARITTLIREYMLHTPLFAENSTLLLGELLYTLLTSSEQTTDVNNVVIRLAEDIQDNFMCGKFDVETYAKEVNLSKDRFSVIFKNCFCYPPYKYQMILKINEATNLLKITDLPIRKIAELVGFSSQLHFSNTYRKHTGMSPSEVRKTNSEE